MEIREIERKGFCRGCDKTLSPPDKVFYTYSHRNRGQNIIFCMDCVDEIYKLRDNILALKAND